MRRNGFEENSVVCKWMLFRRFAQAQHAPIVLLEHDIFATYD